MARDGVDLLAYRDEHAEPVDLDELEAERPGRAPKPKLEPLPWRTVGDWSEVDGADWLTTNPPPRRWLARDTRDIDGKPAEADKRPGVLSRKIVGILASAGGVGKTFALCELAALVAGGGTGTHGCLWLDRFAVEDGPVLFLAGEETGDELRRRLFAVVRRLSTNATGRLHGPALDAIRRNLVIVPTAGVSDLPLLRLDAGGNLAPSARHAEIVARLNAPPGGEGWALVLVDPMVRWAAGDIDRDNMAASALIGAFEAFTKAPGGPTVLVAHHTSKDARKGDVAPTAEAATAGIRGASAITDNARWAAQLTPGRRFEGAPEEIHFAVTKSNYGARPNVKLVRSDEGPLRGATKADDEAIKRAEIEAAKRKGETQEETKIARNEGRARLKGKATGDDA